MSVVFPNPDRTGSRSPKQIVICGGGVAAIEALLALRALLQVGIEVHLVAPTVGAARSG